MKFVRTSALRPVPAFAVVDDVAIAAVEDQLGDGQEALQASLDETYREMDRKQPALARYLAEQVSHREDDLAQSLGYFLVVTVYMAFREAFPTRLREVGDAQLSFAIDSLSADEELRANDPTETMESDDVVAMSQPAVLRFVQHHLDEALAQADEGQDLGAFEGIYRAVLVEVLALGDAVDAPDGAPAGPVALA